MSFQMNKEPLDFYHHLLLFFVGKKVIYTNDLIFN